LGSALLACASRAPLDAVGVSTGGALASHSGPSVPARIPSPLPVDFRSQLARVSARRFTSGGHAGGRFDADVYVTPSAKDEAWSPRGVTPPGTIVVMEEFDHGKATAGPVLMMEKRPPGFDAARGDWRYVVVDGSEVSDGPLDPCASCHDEAPHDHVFALPE